MKELSLHILDIAQNSVRAGALRIDITVEEDGGQMRVTVTDDGRGMDASLLARVTDPYVTTRATRKVGLGIPLLRLAAEQTGGTLQITSGEGKGTALTATFVLDSVDRPPLGDMAGTMATLIQGAPHLDFTYRHTLAGGPEASLDTRLLRGALDGVPLDRPEVLAFVSASLAEEESALSRF